MGVVLHAHPIHGELHIQRNGNREVATVVHYMHKQIKVSRILLYLFGKNLPATIPMIIPNLKFKAIK